MSSYGEKPTKIGSVSLLAWKEFMHYLYLPVKLSGQRGFALPNRLDFLYELLHTVKFDLYNTDLDFDSCYIYVTAKRGYATPDNPLNRPGWHCDGFGTNDLNYIWWDRWPTRFAFQWFQGVSEDHLESMEQFDRQIDERCVVDNMQNRTLYRLNPYVVHTTPLIPAGGGMRSFLKVSVSPDRYNLEGNSHNHRLGYNWRMYPRDGVRNDTTHPERDFVEER